MLGCFLNPQVPFATRNEKIAAAVDLVTVVALVIISVLVLSGVIHCSVTKVETGLAFAGGAVGLVGIDLILIAVKRGKDKKAESPKTAQKPAVLVKDISSTPSTFEGILAAWTEEIKEDVLIINEDRMTQVRLTPHEIYHGRLNAAQKLGECYQLKQEELEFTFTRIVSFPHSFNQLTHLKVIRATDCELVSLPDSFCNLTHLEELDLSYNYLSKLPNSFGSLTNLRVLKLTVNKLECLPSTFGELTNLRVLNLAFNKLEYLPSTFGELTNLKELDLNSNKIDLLQDSFGNLKNLEVLSLFSNKLESFPNTITELGNLKMLNLGKNQLNCLPDSFENLTSLEFFDLVENHLAALPSSLFNLPSLKTLDIQYNDFSEQTKEGIRNAIQGCLIKCTF